MGYDVKLIRQIFVEILAYCAFVCKFCVWVQLMFRRGFSVFGGFANDQRGGIAAFSVAVFLIMFVAVGMGVDFIRHEAHRAELQDAIDRGVLAAAARTQTGEAESIVRDFLLSSNYASGISNVDADVDDTNGIRHVTASASYEIETFFLKVVGIPRLEVTVRSAARESFQFAEISLLLDVSTSMSSCTASDPDNGIASQCEYWEGTPTTSRLEVMKTAAKNFIDTVLADSSSQNVSVSLIPFAGQVDAGPVAFGHLRASKVHGHSHCLDFADADYSTAAMPPYRSLPQSQHTSLSYYYDLPDLDPTIARGGCPHKSSGESILYHSNNRTKLKKRISNLQSHESTGTHTGMKWAAMLLDPSSRVLTGKLVTKGKVDAQFEDRPYDYGTNGNKKFIIAMSDGATTREIRLTSEAYDEDAEYDWHVDNTPSSWDDVVDLRSQASARQMLLNACTAAKDAGIIVFTIGFDLEVGSLAYDDMQACASSSNFFFPAGGGNLDDAFSAIAVAIQKLRLTM